jgi:glucosylceramidase
MRSTSSFGRLVAGVALAGVLSGLLASQPEAQGQPVRVWITAADQTRLLTASPDATFGTSSATGQFVINVDETQQFQTMVGFGASMTESSAWLLATRLAASARADVMAQLFSPVDGIGLSFLRHPIGASDFSLSHYSYDDVPYGESDYGLTRFSAARDDAYVFPALREALRLNPRLTVMASPWSAPGWMKTSGTMVGGALQPAAYNAFASYLVKSVQAMESRGVPVAAITLQNEPRYVPADYPGMYMGADEQAALIGSYVGPAFAAAGLTTQVLAWDQNWSEPEYPLAVLQDPGAARYTSGVAYHCYAGDPAVMSSLHDAHPLLGIFVTECSTGAWAVTPFSTALYENMRVLIRSTRNWAQAVVRWNIALDEDGGPHTGGCTTCSGLLTINRATGAVQRNADFYALGHLSKFVVPGARRIVSSTYESQGIETVAFINPDGSHTLVVWNGWGPRRVTVSWHGAAFGYDLPGDAVATFAWSGTPASSPPAPENPPATAFAIPGSIEAEDFLDGSGHGYADTSSGNSGGAYRATDVDIEPSTDSGGGYNVGWISPGEWLSYPVAVNASGTFRLDARVAANGPGGTFHVEIDGATATPVLRIPDTGGWQNWTTVSASLALAGGPHNLRVVFDAAGSTGIVGNLNVLRVSAVPASAPTTPYTGSAVSLPGRIEAEAFDNGDEGVAYHDKDATNFGGHLRAAGVDLEPTSDAGGGYNVGWMAPGEWLTYATDVPSPGRYRVAVRVAGVRVGGVVHVEADGQNVTGPVAIPNTGSWQTWTTVGSSAIALTAGPHALRLVVDRASTDGLVGNVNWIEVSAEP